MTAPSDNLLTQSAVQELLEDILPFWRRYAVDERRGGFIGQMSNDLHVDEDAPKGLILNARILWTFSAAYAYRQDKRDRTLARRAYAYLMDHFLDKGHGGYFWELDPNGAVRDDKKKVYGEAFCIYALAEYFRVFHEPAALRQAMTVFDLIEAHARDRQYAGYFEVMSRDWQPCEDMRLSDKDGGLFYEGRDGRIINPNKEWWPQAEAVVGFYNAWQLTGEDAFRDAAARCWQFIRDHVVDHEYGEWFWCIRPDGTPDPSQPKVSPWKCPYHNGRCCLEIIRRTQTQSNNGDFGRSS